MDLDDVVAEEDVAMEDAEESEGVQQSATRSFFVEAEELDGLISEIVQAPPDDSQTEARFERAKVILDKYQELPQLLNPYLEGILTPLISAVHKVVEAGDAPLAVDLHTIARLIYVVTKVRGYKSTVHYLPHEVHLLEPVFHYYLRQEATPETWELRYVLLLWLSTIVLIPFNLATVDSNDLSDGLVDSMVGACQKALSDTGIVREGAAFLLSRLLTRPDTHQQLQRFLQWTLPVLEAGPGSTDVFLEVGVLLTLAHVLKHGQRHELLHHVDAMAAIILQQSEAGGTANTLRSKLLLKIAQRIGTTYLPARPVSWQYQRGNRSLVANLAQVHGTGAAGAPSSPMERGDAPQPHPDADDIDVPEQVEDIVGLLLDGLNHRDTVVRWSAAKGLGRVSQRLPKDNADEVLQAVLSNCFDLYEADSGWHGGCLCIAELARRGLLLPTSLPGVIPVVLRALCYSLFKTNHAVGAHVRDAACYVCWAFARAYDPADLQEYVAAVSQQLIITAVFDREVNVRRAAAAAFQECVGRLGTFPHGIDIIQMADYFTLSVRAHAFTRIGPKIADYNAYCGPMMEHLLEHKLGHWDPEIRGYSSQALALLLIKDPVHGLERVLPRLLASCFSAVSDERHGAVLAVAETVLQLSLHCPNVYDGGSAAEGQAVMTPEMLEEVRQVMPRIEAERLYRGKGGDKLRIAVCRLLQCMAEARFPLPKTSQYARAVSSIGRGPVKRERTLAKYQESLEGHIGNFSPQVQKAAVAAFRAFAQHYYTAWDPDLHPAILKRLQEGLDPSKTPNVRRGAGLALGALPLPLLCHDAVFDAVSRLLLQSLRVEADPDVRDAEARANAVVGLADVCCAAATAPAVGLTAPRVAELFGGLLEGLDDYCTDSRGDVGSFTRSAALEAAGRFVFEVAARDARRGAAEEAWLSHALWLRFLRAVAKQLMEKIDRVRGLAGGVLQRVAQSSALPADLPHKAVLQRAIAEHLGPSSAGEGAGSAGAPEMDWSAPGITYPLMVPLLLPLPEFVEPVLEGLVVSAGGLSMHVVRAASAALVGALKALPRDEAGEGVVTLAAVSRALVRMFARYAQDDRVILPLLATLDQLLTHGLVHPEYCLQVIECIKTELNHSPKKDVKKLLGSIKVTCGLLGMPPEADPARPLRTTCLLFALSLLGNRFPKVRASTAQQLYTVLLTFSESFADVDDDAMDDVLAALMDRHWDSADAAAVRAKRDGLYPLLGLEKPAAKASGGAGPKPKPKAAAEEGYAGLVHEAGY